MAAALTSLHHHHSLQYLRRSIKHSTPVPASSPKQSKWCNRYPRTFSGRTKDLEDSATNFESSSPFKFGIVGCYLGMMQTRPIVTDSLTSFFIHAAADLSSQTVVGESSEHDFVRTFRMVGYGMIILGPSLHYWFNFASRVFPSRDYFRQLRKLFWNS